MSSKYNREAGRRSPEPAEKLEEIFDKTTDMLTIASSPRPAVRLEIAESAMTINFWR